MKFFVKALTFSLSVLCICACGNTHKATSSHLFPYYDKAAFITVFSHPRYKAGYMDMAGNRVTDNLFYDAEPFTEGLGCVSTKIDGRILYGYVDSTGGFVIEPQFHKARPFQNGRAWVSNAAGDWGLINTKGELVTEMEYARISTDFCGGHCLAYEAVGSREASKFEDVIVGVFSLGMLDAPDKTIYNCYSIDPAGNRTLLDSNTINTDRRNAVLLRQQNGLAKFWTVDDKFGFKKITESDFENDKANYRDEGETYIQPIYKHAEDFRYGYARVTLQNGDKGYIDTTGTVVFTFREDR